MDLKTQLTKRADLFNQYWTRYFKEGEPPVLYQAARHLPLGGGKRLRPCLAMLACESISGESEKVLPFAAALELLHSFTLVHDDIMDKSLLRRNVQTVHVKYSEPTAILAGDFLYAKSFEAMHDLEVDLQVYKELNQGLVQCVIDICEGQQLDMEFQQRKTVSEQQYIAMIQKKTAVLFSFAAQGGAVIGEGATEVIQALAEYGTSLGLSFQIWDDYLDLSSTKDVLGKDIGNDIRNGKKTLIAVHALHHARKEEKKVIDLFFGNPQATEENIHDVLSVFKDLQSIEYARQTAESYCQSAQQSLQVLSDSPAKKLLLDLAQYSIQREK